MIKIKRLFKAEIKILTIAFFSIGLIFILGLRKTEQFQPVFFAAWYLHPEAIYMNIIYEKFNLCQLRGNNKSLSCVGICGNDTQV